MNSDSRFKVAFLCSPNIGTLENWLPVFAELKRINSQVRIICLIPKPSISMLIDSDSDLVKISENYIDEVVFKSYSEKWIKFKSLSAAKKANTLPKLLHIMLKIENYFKKFFPTSMLFDGHNEIRDFSIKTAFFSGWICLAAKANDTPTPNKL